MDITAEQQAEIINDQYGDDAVDPADLVVIDGIWTIDGHPAMEWADAMYGIDDED